MSRRPFTKDEDNLIRQHGCEGTAALLRLMPYRTMGSIHNRASRMKVLLGEGRPRVVRGTISLSQRAEILRQCRYHANDKTIADYLDVDVEAVARVRAQAPLRPTVVHRAPEAVQPDRYMVGVPEASAALCDRICAHFHAIAEREGVSPEIAQAIAIYGAAARARFITSMKGSTNAGQ